MWKVETEELREGSAWKYRFPKMACVEVIEAWRTDPEFCEFFGKCIADCPFTAFTWEVKPMNGRDIDAPFECVVSKSTRLHRVKVSPKAFRSHFEKAGDTLSVLTFANKQKDAIFVVPSPRDYNQDIYTHLGTFLRSRNREQKLEFWRCLGEETSKQLSLEPIWLSTSKVGVPWVHARLDRKPKYARHEEYQSFEESPVQED